MDYEILEEYAGVDAIQSIDEFILCVLEDWIV